MSGLGSMEQLSVFKGSRVLVTGHTGFKGSWLSLWLSQLGADVFGVSKSVPTNPSHFTEEFFSKIISDHRLDIQSTDEIKVLIDQIQPDFIFHLAAQSLVRHSYIDPLSTWKTNALGTINVLEALRGIKKSCVAIFITSDKCYENVEWVWGYRETDSLGGSDPYGASKAAAELAIRSYVQSFFPIDGRVRIGVGRAGNVIGGGDWAPDRIVPDCVRAWSLGETVSLRNPLATRPWQHVLEPLSGYLSLALALTRDENLHGEPFNFGPTDINNHSVGSLVTEIAKHWEKVSWEDLSLNEGGPFESGLLKLNCDKALHHLNWHSVWDFQDTVRETAVWYREYYECSSNSIIETSLRQINKYVSEAKIQGIPWTR